MELYDGTSSNNGTKGCFLEGDLNYSDELDDSYNEYSLTPEKLKFKKGILSEYQSKIIEEEKIFFRKNDKLILGLKNTLHYKNDVSEAK